jgi:hypothetical protein
MNEEILSKKLSAKGKTYFFDLKKSKNNNIYLQITESRAPDKEGKRQRFNIIVFQEDLENFKKVLAEIKVD